MNTMNIAWIFKLKKEIPIFLENMQPNKESGFFKYSFSGDLPAQTIHWGLANAVFAVKIYYTLGKLNTIPQEQHKALTKFILSFRGKNGYFSDPIIQQKSRLRNLAFAIKNIDLNNLNGYQTKRAETRQAISALKLLNPSLYIDFSDFPQSMSSIEKYLRKLPWDKPWNAGSHFSHLLFFLNNSNSPQKSKLINFTIDWIKNIQHKQDGCWYKHNASMQQKINGAMKIITGMKAANNIKLNYPEKLIDTCLTATNTSHACDNFNIIYVLKYANEETNGKYRFDEIRHFCLTRLDTYKQFYHPNVGGFSFYANKTNSIYYGAKISKGLNEPDIHGTVMFLWGISIIAQILKINNELQFSEFTT